MTTTACISLSLAPGLDSHKRQSTHDLRRHREILVDMARFMPPADAALIEHIYGRGIPLRDVARLLGQPDHRLRRRLRRLRQRLQTPMASYLIRYSHALPVPVRRTAQLVAFAGLSLRQAAAVQELSLHQVRRHMLIARTRAARHP